MGSAVVMLLAENDRVVWGHVGDPRLYRFRGNQWRQLTVDHSMAQVLVRMVEVTPNQVRSHPARNRLLQSLGHAECQIEVSEQKTIRAGDIFLQCSDGFWGYLMENGMVADLKASVTLDEWLVRMESRLLNRIKELGKQQDQDNYTAQAISVGIKSALNKPR
ncbi:MAG: hypothetical protein LUQ26_14340 [Methylococcaceae bacterium]|nr:hypothetical protein [Methylococcaceae bacterium]